MSMCGVFGDSVYAIMSAQREFMKDLLYIDLFSRVKRLNIKYKLE